MIFEFFKTFINLKKFDYNLLSLFKFYVLKIILILIIFYYNFIY